MRRPSVSCARRVLLAGAVLVAAWVAAPAAAGATSCALVGTTLTVTTDESAVIARSGQDITVTAGVNVPCAGSPTVINTDRIVVTGTLDGSEQLAIDQSAGGAFEPGATAEAVGTSEIELDVSGTTFTGGAALLVAGTPGDDTITIGSDGVALNDDDDLDLLLPASVGQLRVQGLDGDDVVVATGGHGTGGPSPNRSLYLSGGQGADVLDASDGDAGPGADLVDGGPGDDRLAGDQADGVYFANAPSGGTIDLAAGTATTGDGSDTISTIENVFGTMFDDTIVGTAWSNVIFGLGGADVIHGGQSQDRIDGGDGNDWIFAEGGEDVVEGGSGDDVLSESFENGFTASLAGGPGDDRYELAFGLAAGTIQVDEADGEGDDEIVVTCAAPGVTDAQSGAGSGTVSGGDELAPYTGIETVTIPAACAPVAPPPGPPAGPPPPGPVPVAGPVSVPWTPGPPPAHGGALGTEAETLGAFVAAAERGRGRVRLDASATFLVRGGEAVDPRGWSWRLAGQRGALAAWREAVLVLTGRALTGRTVRARVAVSGSAGVVADALVRLPRAASRRLVLRLPAATLASERLREAALERAGGVARRRELRVLPRTLAALDRSLGLLAAGGRQAVLRLRVSTPAPARWLRRLEQLSADRLERALGRHPIALSAGARLVVLAAPSSSGASVTFATRGRVA